MDANIKNAYAAWAKLQGLKITRPSHNGCEYNQVSLRCIKGKYKLEIVREQKEEVQLKWLRDENGKLPERVNSYDYPVFSGTAEQLLHYFKTGETQLQQIDKAKKAG